MYDFLKAVFQNRKLLLELTKNDFKQRYVGNFLGVLWAFIQPTITVAIFWFVFQVGFRSHPVEHMPYILWLIAGMFPWFYFAEAFQNGTNSVMSNSFLVKKVVFRVSLVPIVPLLAAVAVHLFFVLVMFGMYMYYGYMPSIYWLQIFYYIFATSVLILGLSWITSSIVIFFKDMGQFVAVVIQFGFWLTPIFWNISMVPEKYQWLIKLNPMFYIIKGYRNSLIYHKWFWQDWHVALYFWVVTGIIFIVGGLTFRKLRPHFADVL